MMQRLRCLIPATALVAVLCGCNGTLGVHPETGDEMTKGYEGVRFFPLYKMQTTWQNTTIRDGTKVLASMWGTGSAHCVPTPYTTVSIDVDPDSPMIVKYTPGLLETYEFSTSTSERGNLTAVGVQSTPDQGKTISNLSDATKNFGTLAAGGGGGRPGVEPRPCTDDAKAIAYARYKG